MRVLRNVNSVNASIGLFFRRPGSPSQHSRCFAVLEGASRREGHQEHEALNIPVRFRGSVEDSRCPPPPSNPRSLPFIPSPDRKIQTSSCQSCSVLGGHAVPEGRGGNFLFKEVNVLAFSLAASKFQLLLKIPGLLHPVGISCELYPTMHFIWVIDSSEGKRAHYTAKPSTCAPSPRTAERFKPKHQSRIKGRSEKTLRASVRSSPDRQTPPVKQKRRCYAPRRHVAA